MITYFVHGDGEQPLGATRTHGVVTTDLPRFEWGEYKTDWMAVVANDHHSANRLAKSWDADGTDTLDDDSGIPIAKVVHKSIAQVAATLLGDDGLETADGIDIDTLVSRLGAHAFRDAARGPATRHQFDDGSALVTHRDRRGSWSLGFTGGEFEDCLCWPSSEPAHNESCPHREDVATRVAAPSYPGAALTEPYKC